MSIEQFDGRCDPTCDLCGDTLEREWSEEAARKAMKEAGWVQQYIDGVLMDVCTECQEKQKPEPEPFIISRETQKFFGG